MYYKLQVSLYNDFSVLSVNKLVKEVTYDIITYGLEPSTFYYWRVKSINNSTGKESDWSDLCNFKTRGLDIIINQANSSENVIIYEAGNNVVTTCITPEGELGSGICVSGIGGDTLGSGMCTQHCSVL